MGDLFMVPEDPMGRNGPKLNDFLSEAKSIITEKSSKEGPKFKERKRHRKNRRSKTDVQNTSNTKNKNSNKEPEIHESNSKSKLLLEKLTEIFPEYSDVIRTLVNLYPDENISFFIEKLLGQ